MIVPKFAKFIFRILIILVVFYGLFLTYKEESKNLAIIDSNSINTSLNTASATDKHSEYKQQTISLGEKTFTLYIADTEELRTKGLSGWRELLPNEAMVFVFDEEGIYPFWMKDMLFPIDIVWLDSSFRPVHFEKNISPKTYPTLFKSNVLAKYVIEVPAGTIDQISK